ncbi:MAG: paeninodin family lasso peptide [Anaerobacillus sp.]|uniref:paeninodin family lasso peptide n=1 Tax=Anaerobacillus sp. TaxID=1872506 RepID=UPI00391DE2FA
MKKTWKQPELKALNVGMTMGGAGEAQADSYCTSQHPTIDPDGKINKACANPDLLS